MTLPAIDFLSFSKKKRKRRKKTLPSISLTQDPLKSPARFFLTVSVCPIFDV
jgi:hypothetical protein